MELILISKAGCSSCHGSGFSFKTLESQEEPNIKYKLSICECTHVKFTRPTCAEGLNPRGPAKL